MRHLWGGPPCPPALFALAALATGCGLQDVGAQPTSDAPVDNDAISCNTYLTFDPASVIAGPDAKVRAIAHIGGLSGVLDPSDYVWTVTFGSTTTTPPPAQPDNSEVEFPVVSAGLYSVDLQIANHFGAPFCTEAHGSFNVDSGLGNAEYRLAVRAPNAPPQERSLAFSKGVTSYGFGTYTLDLGKLAAGSVRNGGSNVSAYLRFIPIARPDQFVEAFSAADGTFSAQILDEPHEVLVVPFADLAPKRLAYAAGTTLISVGLGATAQGFVKTPANLALPNASVQISLDGVPSTIDQTDSTGHFAVRYEPRAGATVSIEVVPPAASGLPRLEASGAFDPTAQIDVKYAAAITTRALGGFHVQRDAAAIANTRIDVVGEIGAAGTITTGTTSVPSLGTFHATVVTDAAGTLPALLAPAAVMSIVAEIGAADHPMLPLDLAQAPSDPIALAPVATTVVVVTDADTNAAKAMHVSLVPHGLLALAGIAAVELVTDASGSVSIPFAANAHYDLRISDPAGKAAPFEASDVTATTVDATIQLARAVTVTGTIKAGNNPVAGASVQVLCKSCIGVDRTRPIAQAASLPSGAFTVAVPDLP